MKVVTYTIAACLVAAAIWSYAHFSTDASTVADMEPAAGPQEGAQEGQQQAMPITTSVLESQNVQQWHSFSGTLVAVDMVDIRPRVGGAIEKIYFEPGAIIEAGTPLFLIDPRPYQAEVNRQSAALASARALASLAKSESARAQRLIKENAIAQRDFDSRQNALSVAQAAVKSAEAALQQANLNLDFATIKAPVTGKISRAEITEGNLMDAGASAPILASLVSMDPIYADFDVDEQTYLANVRLPVGDDGNGGSIPVELALNSDITGNAYQGRIVSFDNKLDSSAGTIRARAIFDNPGNRLVPGMFAKIRLGSASTIDAILIPDRVINTDQDKKFVYTVNAEGKAEYRLVKLGGTINGMRVVESGLESGERIIVNGLMRVRPGMDVQPQDVPLTETPAKDATAKPSEDAPALQAVTPEQTTEYSDEADLNDAETAIRE